MQQRWDFSIQLFVRRGRPLPGQLGSVKDWKGRYLISPRNLSATPTESWVGKLYLAFKTRKAGENWLMVRWASESLCRTTCESLCTSVRTSLSRSGATCDSDSVSVRTSDNNASQQSAWTVQPLCSGAQEMKNILTDKVNVRSSLVQISQGVQPFNWYCCPRRMLRRSRKSRI